jgi:hypothetical protein
MDSSVLNEGSDKMLGLRQDSGRSTWLFSMRTDDMLRESIARMPTRPALTALSWSG